MRERSGRAAGGTARARARTEQLARLPVRADGPQGPAYVADDVNTNAQAQQQRFHGGRVPAASPASQHSHNGGNAYPNPSPGPAETAAGSSSDNSRPNSEGSTYAPLSSPEAGGHLGLGGFVSGQTTETRGYFPGSGSGMDGMDGLSSGPASATGHHMFSTGNRRRAKSSGLMDGQSSAGMSGGVRRRLGLDGQDGEGDGVQTLTRRARATSSGSGWNKM